MSSTSSAAPCCASAARVTSPISFLSHQSFMSVIRRFPLLVATLIPLLFMTVTPSTVDAAVVSANVLASCPVLDCASGSTPRPNTFFPVHVASDVAQFWDSYYGQNFKIINVTGSGEQYVLYQCGTDRPVVGPVTVLSADYQNDGGIVERTQTVQILPNAKFFTIPLKKVCVYETVVMTFMEQLGVRTSIHKVAAKYTTSPCINQLVTENKIKQLKSYPIDPTEQTDCDAVIMYGNKASPDPKTITFLATTDTGSLNRAEYLDYLSLFFNKEAAANSVFPPIVKRYNALAEKAKAKTGKKKAAWISGFGSFDIDTAAYKVDLMASAGFDVLTLPAGSQTSFKNSADLLKVLRENNVEVFIDDAYAVKNFDAFLVYYNITGVDAVPETSNYLFIKHKQILRIDGLKSKNDAHDWFESAVPNMDAVLTDLVYRSYPDLVPSSWSRKWFRNIGLGEGTQIIVEECTDVSAATLPLLDETPGPAGYKCPEWLMNPSLYVNNTAPRTGGAVQANGIVHGVIAAIIVMGTMMQLFFH